MVQHKKNSKGSFWIMDKGKTKSACGGGKVEMQQMTHVLEADSDPLVHLAIRFIFNGTVSVSSILNLSTSFAPYMVVCRSLKLRFCCTVGMLNELSIGKHVVSVGMTNE